MILFWNDFTQNLATNKSRLAEICTARCHPKQTPVLTDDQDIAREKRYKKLIHSLATKYASLRDCRGK